jgi:hypothetical protein
METIKCYCENCQIGLPEACLARVVRDEPSAHPERFCGYCGTRLDETGRCPADPVSHESK